MSRDQRQEATVNKGMAVIQARRITGRRVWGRDYTRGLEQRRAKGRPVSDKAWGNRFQLFAPLDCNWGIPTCEVVGTGASWADAVSDCRARQS